MQLAPRPADVPKIPGALSFYKWMAYITGTFLLLLVGEMLLKYALGVEIEVAGPFGFVALVPAGTVVKVNASTGILIIHGWLYVVYLFSGFRLWSMMRWPFIRFIVIALGGVVPGLSFVVEHYYKKPVEAFIAQNQGA